MTYDQWKTRADEKLIADYDDEYEDQESRELPK
jgi:hypothetical protein